MIGWTEGRWTALNTVWRSSKSIYGANNATFLPTNLPTYLPAYLLTFLPTYHLPTRSESTDRKPEWEINFLNPLKCQNFWDATGQIFNPYRTLHLTHLLHFDDGT